MTVQVWTIEQLDGDHTSIVLSGYAAPFGRPRKKPVAKEIVKSRVQSTNYPGKRLPTRHSFKTMYEPLELEGRWMTKALSRGQTANELADLVGGLVHDEQPCRISWGNIVSYAGYLEELELGRESEHEIAWKLKILIDARDADEQDAPAIKRPTISAQIPEVDASIKRLKLKRPGDLLNDIQGMADGFNDAIDGFVSDLKSPLATLNKISKVLSELSAIADRVAGLPAEGIKINLATLQQLKSVTKQLRATLNNVFNTVINTPVNVAIAVNSSVGNEMKWLAYQTRMELELNELFDTIAVMERTAEIHQLQEAVGVITARGSDVAGFRSNQESWESLSYRATGSSSSAARIRDLNGGASAATAGEDYLY